MTEPPYTTSEAAAILRLSPASVRTLCRTGQLPGAYRGTGTGSSPWRIPRTAITHYTDKRTQQ